MFPTYNDKEGREILDETPVEAPLRMRKPLTLQEQVDLFLGRALYSSHEPSDTLDDLDVDDDGQAYDDFPYEIEPPVQVRKKKAPVPPPAPGGEGGTAEKPAESSSDPKPASS
ncbi:hypothetical protein [Termite gut associated microvirus 2]|nr:hypothetical protein [Termite gut associated microvirus 2]